MYIPVIINVELKTHLNTRGKNPDQLDKKATGNQSNHLRSGRATLALP